MRALSLIDFAMYFLAGVFGVLLSLRVARRSDAAEPEPPSGQARAALLAAASGVLLVCLRYGIIECGKMNAMRQLSATLEVPAGKVLVE